MSFQGPILIVTPQRRGDSTADIQVASGLAQLFNEAGASRVIEVSWDGAAVAASEVQPAAIVLSGAETASDTAAISLARYVADAIPVVPVIALTAEDAFSAFPVALTLSDQLSPNEILARTASALRLRALHATVLARAKTLMDRREIVAEMPSGDPLDDATVLLIGRGRHHPALSTAMAERMNVIGAFSTDQGARFLGARTFDGVILGDGLAVASIEHFLDMMAKDYRFCDLPVGMLGALAEPAGLRNVFRARAPQTLVDRSIAYIRMRAREMALKRLLASIESKGMIDAGTGLFTEAAFSDALNSALAECKPPGARLSMARIAFDEEISRRASVDAARLVSRLIRDVDFACRRDDGSILLAFGTTDLRDAHVIARRIASVLKHTMLRSFGATPQPSLTLAAWKRGETADMLLERVRSPTVVAA